MRKYTYAMLFRDFREAYPNKWRKGTSYLPDGFMSIKVRIPNDGEYKYEYFGNKLTLIEPYMDPIKMKYWKIFEREQQMFLIASTMKKRGINQSYLSEMTGISRQSINQYISGKRVPKQSTIDIMMTALGIEDDKSWMPE